MSKIIWLTPSGSIARVAEQEYFEFQLDSYDTTGSAITYSVIAGQLASGLQLFKSGLIQGIPVVEVTSEEEIFTQTFTVRATNAQKKISDRTFSITINAILIPQIVPKDTSLGAYYDGYYLDIDLVAVDPSPLAKIKWKLVEGELPGGVTLSSSGKISGNIKPFISAESEAVLGWSVSSWDHIPWDSPTAAAQTKTYSFTVRAFDGTRYDISKYTIKVQAKSLFTADNSELLVNDTNLTVDVDDAHTPFITTLPQELTPQRQDSNFAFKFTGQDLDGDEIRYAMIILGEAAFDQGPTVTNPLLSTTSFDEFGFDQAGQSIPPGITLDPVTGWLSGHLGTQFEVEKTYTFQIYCYKLQDPLSVSRHVTFTLTVLGDLTNTITWLTPEFLGTIDNGSVSEFVISATSSKGKILNYSLKDGRRNPDNIFSQDHVVLYEPLGKHKVPQGLVLRPDGLLIGRVSFDHFTLDGGATTIDRNNTKIDTEYTFTVTAADAPGVDQTVWDDNTTEFDHRSTGFDSLTMPTVSADKTFTIRVNPWNTTPYENIYLKALPSREQREAFSSLISNEEIFPPQLIYRETDPWFGKARNMKFLFAAGMNPSLAATYIGNMQHNHYNKRINLGDVKTAVALDENFNVRYEVVYVEVLDTLTQNGKSIAKSIDRTPQVKPPYNVEPYKTIYPNSFANMKADVEGVGYENKGALPVWMVNQQADGRVLGFTRAIILAYTIPGAADLIAYRLSQSKADFNDLDFVADRYQLDHHMSNNFDIELQKFKESKETTFDRLPPAGGQHPAAGAVDFAVTVPFDEINGRTTEYLARSGGLDGSIVKSGQLIVFARQEQFSQTLINDIAYVKSPYDTNVFDSIGFNLSNIPREYTSPNDGWNIDGGLYGADPYDSTDYAPSAIVPGFLDNLLTPTTPNMRAGIWRVDISTDDVITLIFVSEVLPNEYVQVAGGNSFGSTKLYYDPIIKDGNTVPEYSILSSANAPSTSATRFDAGGTRFSTNRDVYASPEVDDIYLKFPKVNIY